MEETHVDGFWLLLLASKWKPFSSIETIALVSALFFSWLSVAVWFWALSPGGPAWGRYFWTRGKKTTRPIPGPRGLPVVGSMGLMTGLAHRKLGHVARAFGAERLMAFSVGETRFVLTCDPDVAKDMLNSSVFADRPIKESAYGLLFNRAIGFAPYGVYWRTLRRIASTHLFSPKQIGVSAAQRSNIAAQMGLVIGSQTGSFRVRDMLKQASLHNIMVSVFGREYELGSSSGEANELRDMVEEGYEMLGKLNWSDHLPWLASFDLQKIRFRCSNLVPRVNRFVNRIIDEHRIKTGQRSHDFVDVLLSLQGPDKLSDHDMVAVLWEMIFRGTDTVAVLIEWVLARMVLHPEAQSKVQEELDRVVGRSRPFEESDIQSTAYLQAVVKEVLRMHPPGPLLSWARLAITDTTLDGYHVPAGTTAMVNMWAITRDPRVWEDPLEFSPDRFLARDATVEFSVMGSDLRLAPFGSGRRACPGKALGLTTVYYWVGYLLHEFKFSGSGQNPVDLSEVLRLSCEMATPLSVTVQPRRR